MLRWQQQGQGLVLKKSLRESDMYSLPSMDARIWGPVHRVNRRLETKSPA